VDTRLPYVGSSAAEISDESVQREWDRSAMPDHSGDGDSFSTPIALRARITKTTLARWTNDSFPAYDSTTALGDAFAKAQSSDLSQDNADVRHGCRRS
jgi:hypothetical protein